MKLAPPGLGANKSTKSSKPKVFVTSGRDVALRGMCLIFTRVNPGKPITDGNVTQELSFMTLDAQGGGYPGQGLLHGIEMLLSSVFIPALQRTDKGWGELNNKDGKVIKDDFINTLESFAQVMVGKCLLLSA